MANPRKLLHSFYILLMIFSIPSESTYARPLIRNLRTLDFIKLAKMLPQEKNNANRRGESSTITQARNDPTVVNVDASRRIYKLGPALGPSLMNMLPKGNIHVSGPSKRINDINN
ncbi:Unknown protein [Striga hermonthica]|uniref:Uncharacterized protein n=1 Tax=Striga hermonthica TaxID=68872 RepID=A0A9N7RNH6_STRHE|nr:Unknown protein [Striga hermonthica]